MEEKQQPTTKPTSQPPPFFIPLSGLSLWRGGLRTSRHTCGYTHTSDACCQLSNHIHVQKHTHVALKNTNVQIKQKWAKNPLGRDVHCDSVLILKKCSDLSLSLTRSLSFYPTPPQQHGLVQGSSNLTSSVVHGNVKFSNVLSFQIFLMLGRDTFELFHNQIIKLKVRRKDDTWLWEA